MNKPPRSTHLYILSCTNRLKIGITNNIDTRIKTLQTGNPEPIKLEYIEERYKPHKAETYLHHKFQKYQVSGEWFEGISIDQIRVALMLFHDQDNEPE